MLLDAWMIPLRICTSEEMKNPWVINFGCQSSLPTAAALRTQCHRRNTVCGIGKANIRTSCNSRGQSSVIDAELIVDTSNWRVEPAFLTADDEITGWQKVNGATGLQGMPNKSGLSYTKDISLRREFVENTQDSMTNLVPVGEEDAPERSSDFLLESEAGSYESHCNCEKDEGTSKASKYTHVSQRPRILPARPVSWRLCVEGVHGPPLFQVTESKRGLGTSSQNLQEKIIFLESLGLDCSALLARYPLLSTCQIENVRGVVRFLEDLQLRRKDVIRILTHNPQLLGQSIDDMFLPAVKFLLKEVGLREEDLGKVVNRCPRLLTARVDEQLRPTMLFLESLGFTHMPIVVSNNATLLTFSIDNKLMPKIHFLQSLGLTHAEALQVLIRFPAIFNYSLDGNLRPKYAYLVGDMGRSLDDLKAFPQYFGYSLESRIKPRHQFLEERNHSLCLPNLLRPSDEEFYARFNHEDLRRRQVVRKKIPSSVS